MTTQTGRRTRWRPMRGTPLSPWQEYSARLIQRSAPISEEARRLADEVCRRVDVPRERAEQLAQHCVERGEARMLVRMAAGVGVRRRRRAWAALLDEVIRVRRTRRGKKGRR